MSPEIGQLILSDGSVVKDAKFAETVIERLAEYRILHRIPPSNQLLLASQIR